MEITEEQIRQALSNKNITIHKENYNSFTVRCLNPSHNDKNPSMPIFKNSGLAYCPSCGYKVSFYDWSGQSYSFKENGVKPEGSSTPIYDPFKNPRSTVCEIVGETFPIQSNYKINNFVMQDLACYNSEIIEKLSIVYCKNAVIRCIGAKDGGGNRIKPLPFFNRILFPIYFEGKLVNVEGRDYTLRSKHKVIYVKGASSDYLYNWENIDPTKPLFITEGVKGLMKVLNETSNVVASFRAMFTPRQIQLINSHPNKVVQFIDNDSAGWASLKRNAEKLVDKELYFCYVGIQPKDVNGKFKGLDPNDGTLAEIRKAISSPISYSEWLIDQYIK